MVSTRARAPTTTRADSENKRYPRNLPAKTVEPPNITLKAQNTVIQDVVTSTASRSRRRRRQSDSERDGQWPSRPADLAPSINWSPRKRKRSDAPSTNRKCALAESSTAPEASAGLLERGNDAIRAELPSTRLNAEKAAATSVTASKNTASDAIGSGDGQLAREAGRTPAPGPTTSPASLQLQDSSLPLLDNLATQILRLFTASPLNTILAFSRKQDCDISQIYETLKALFNQTKRIYPEEKGFIPLHGFAYVTNEHIRIVRQANAATFFSAIFESVDVEFPILLDQFFKTIVVESAKMQDVHFRLLTESVTQACLSDIAKGWEPLPKTLQRYFPASSTQSSLIPETSSDSQKEAESNHRKQMHERRAKMLRAASSSNYLTILYKQHPWRDFLQLWHTYLQTNLFTEDQNACFLLDHVSRPLASSSAGHGSSSQEDQNDGERNMPEQHQIDSRESEHGQTRITSDQIIEKAAKAAHSAIRDQRRGGRVSGSEPEPEEQRNQTQLRLTQEARAPGPPIQFHFEYGLHPDLRAPMTQISAPASYHERWQAYPNAEDPLDSFYDGQDTIPYPTQSAPTRVLYERARMAAASKSSIPTPRKASINSPSQRRPWTADEEHALMAGLDRVKGPRWSQIHTMFGPSGTINQTLKDRSQVQMKDKARNLKLFFLKSNIEVPYYLQFVTGELKTRAPSRVVNHDLDRDARVSDEDRAHVQGVMTLAGSALPDGDPSNNISRENVSQPRRTPNDAFQPTAMLHPDNVDPSLETSLPLQTDYRGGQAIHAGSPYPVPTPDMIMQNLDRFTAPSEMK